MPFPLWGTASGSVYGDYELDCNVEEIKDGGMNDIDGRKIMMKIIVIWTNLTQAVPVVEEVLDSITGSSLLHNQ